MSTQNVGTITLSNRVQLSTIGVTAGPVTYQGVSRDCLTFLFDPESVSIQNLMELFSPENCSAVTITDDSGSFEHEHYTIRTGVGVSCFDLAARGMIGGAVQQTQPTAWVSMAQSTETERAIQSQQLAINALLAAAQARGDISSVAAT